MTFKLVMRKSQREAGQSQHGEDKGLQETNNQAEHYPEFRYNPRSQLVQYNQQDFACQNVTE